MIRNYVLAALAISALSFTATAKAEGKHDHHHHHHHHGNQLNSDRPEPLKDRSVYNLTSRWTDQSGKSRKLTDFKGKPVVSTMLYTSCQTACPIILSDLKRIELALSEEERAKVLFVVFTFDPKRDNPAQFQKFAKAHNLDPSRWFLLAGNDSTTRELAAVFGIRYKRDSGGDFSHSNVISVLDRDGVIHSQEVGLKQDPAKTVGPLRALLK